jgi:hypothetical protein
MKNIPSFEFILRYSSSQLQNSMGIQIIYMYIYIHLYIKSYNYIYILSLISSILFISNSSPIYQCQLWMPFTIDA